MQVFHTLQTLIQWQPVEPPAALGAVAHLTSYLVIDSHVAVSISRTFSSLSSLSFERTELPAKLQNYFLWSNKSNINQSPPAVCFYLYA